MTFFEKTETETHGPMMMMMVVVVLVVVLVVAAVGMKSDDDGDGWKCETLSEILLPSLGIDFQHAKMFGELEIAFFCFLFPLFSFPSLFNSLSYSQNLFMMQYILPVIVQEEIP